MEKPILNIALPSGSLKEMMIGLFTRAGFVITQKNRSYFPEINDPAIRLTLLRPQEIPRYVSEEKYDLGISGQDLIEESGQEVVQIMEIPISKKGSRSVQLVLAVSENSPYKKPEDLDGKLVATEYLRIAKNYFSQKSIKTSLEFSVGSTEAKPPYLADGIIDHLDSGDTFRANNLRIVDSVMTSTNRLIANKKSFETPWKRKKIEEVAALLKKALQV